MIIHSAFSPIHQLDKRYLPPLTALLERRWLGRLPAAQHPTDAERETYSPNCFQWDCLVFDVLCKQSTFTLGKSSINVITIRNCATMLPCARRNLSCRLGSSRIIYTERIYTYVRKYTSCRYFMILEHLIVVLLIVAFSYYLEYGMYWYD